MNFIDRAKYPVAKWVGIGGLTVASLSACTSISMVDDDLKESGKDIAGSLSAATLGIGGLLAAREFRNELREKEKERIEKALLFAANNAEHGEIDNKSIWMEADQPIYPLIL